MTSTSPWDDIDATLLGLARAGLTLAELVEQSGLGSDAVKGFVTAYTDGGWLTQAQFSPTYELTVLGHTKLAALRQSDTSLVRAA